MAHDSGLVATLSRQSGASALALNPAWSALPVLAGRLVSMKRRRGRREMNAWLATTGSPMEQRNPPSTEVVPGSQAGIPEGAPQSGWRWRRRLYLILGPFVVLLVLWLYLFIVLFWL